MDVSQNETLRAFENLPAFLAARGHTLLKEPHAQSGPDERASLEAVSDVIAQLGRWEAVARTARGGTAVVYLLSAEAEAGRGGRSTDEMRKLLAQAVIWAEKTPGAPLEEVLVFATKSMLAPDKAVQGVVKEFNEAAGAAPPYYFAYPYSLLAAVIPSLPSVSRHEVALVKDVEAYLRINYLKPAELPRLDALSDPPAIWCGAYPGDYVQVWSRSETAAAEVPEFRRCGRVQGYDGRAPLPEAGQQPP